ncbi:unnamed protein product [Aspergillus oryzae]|nr:unnamed protein product [Aspergillus oryzae]
MKHKSGGELKTNGFDTVNFVNGSGKALSHDRDTKMDVSWWTRSTLERHGKHWTSSQGIIRGPHLKMGTKTHRMATRPKSQ